MAEPTLCVCDGCKPNPVRSVCVIGAGPVGLAAIKSMKEVGIPTVVCFEQEKGIGGVWRYSPGSPEELKVRGIHSSAYESLDTNSSIHMTEYSDFPYLKAAKGNYASHQEIMQYFNDYANHFNLYGHIRFQSQVISVQKKGLSWAVLVRDRLGHHHKMFFDAVLVCSGQFWKPTYPNFPGQERFQGTHFHSHYYRSADVLKGKNVVLVGVGNSALDIAAALGQAGAKVTVSSRSGTLLADSDALGPPFDTQIFSRFDCEYARPQRNATFYKRIQKTTEELIKRGLVQPPTNPINAHTSILKRAPDFITMVDEGKITLKPNISEIKSNTVLFTDGSELPCDVLIYCTGYDFTFPFLDKAFLPGIGKRRLEYYRLFMHPEHSTLNILGQIDSLGSMFTVGEMQSRYLAQIFSQKMSAPCVAMRQKEVAEFVQKVEKVKPLYQMFVDYYAYMEDLAADIGCKPDLSARPDLFKKLMFGPLYALQYRLDGPGKWGEAPMLLAKL